MCLRSVLLVSSLVALASPATALARPPAPEPLASYPSSVTPSAPASSGGLRLTVLGGAAFVANGGGGPAMRADARMRMTTFPSGVVLSAGLTLRTLYTHDQKTISGGSLETSALDVELTPAARLGVPVGKRLEIHVELGAGAARTMSGTTTAITYRGRTTVTDSHMTGLLRVGLGVEVALGPALRLAFEPLTVGYRFDGTSDTALLGGVTFAL